MGCKGKAVTGRAALIGKLSGGRGDVEAASDRSITPEHTAVTPARDFTVVAV
jgi:hypothetical protein